MKSIFASKINWAGLVIVLTSIQNQFSGLDLSKMTVQSWITFGLGISIIICRTFFTTIPVTQFAVRFAASWKAAKTSASI